MWRSRPAITSSRAGGWSRRPGNTTGSCRSARNAGAHPGSHEAVERVKGRCRRQGRAWPRAWIHQKRPNIGHGKPGPVPPGVDYAMWQGPAPDRPFYANRFHYNWHWFWNWGTGELGNNGIHGVDVARWGLGVDAPLSVASGGGKFVFDDDQEVPDTQIATWEFPHACLSTSIGCGPITPPRARAFGVAFYGDKGTLIVSEKGWRIEEGDGSRSKPGPDEARISTSRTSSIASRAARSPTPTSRSGTSSTRLCHLGNIAFRVGKKLTFDADRRNLPRLPGRCLADPRI